MTARIDHALGWHLEDLRDFELRLVAYGRPFTLKNSKSGFGFVRRATNPRTPNRCPGCRLPLSVSVNLTSSKPAKQYLSETTLQLQSAWNRVFREPIPLRVFLNAAIRSYRATKHWNDSSNLYQAPEDALQAAGVLVDDFQIASHDGSRRLYDATNPRVEIVLTPYRGEPQVFVEHAEPERLEPDAPELPL